MHDATISKRYSVSNQLDAVTDAVTGCTSLDDILGENRLRKRLTGGENNWRANSREELAGALAGRTLSGRLSAVRVCVCVICENRFRRERRSEK